MVSATSGTISSHSLTKNNFLIFTHPLFTNEIIKVDDALLKKKLTKLQSAENYFTKTQVPLSYLLKFGLIFIIIDLYLNWNSNFKMVITMITSTFYHSHLGWKFWIFDWIFYSILFYVSIKLCYGSKMFLSNFFCRNNGSIWMFWSIFFSSL